MRRPSLLWLLRGIPGLFPHMSWHGNVTAADSLEEAVEMARLLAGKDDVILAFGSLSFLGDLIRIAENGAVRRDTHGR